MNIKDLLSKTISDSQGIKATELATLILSELYKNKEYSNLLTDKDYLNYLDEMVKDKEIVEVEYILPSMEYRIKSFYLPKGTIVTIK